MVTIFSLIKHNLVNDIKELIKTSNGKCLQMLNQSDYYRRPIHAACKLNKLEIVKIILSHPLGRKTLLPKYSNYNYTPLHIVCRKPDTLEIVKEILKYPEGRQLTLIKENYYNGNTPLIYCILHNYIMNMLEILKCSQGLYSLNICDDSGGYPLHIASKYGRPLLFREIIHHSDKNILLYKSGDHDMTPLNYACCSGKLSIVNDVLKFSEGVASIEILDAYNRTALHSSCHFQHHNIVKQLLRHIPTLLLCKKLDQQYKSPFHHACYNGNEKLIKLLMLSTPITEIKKIPCIISSKYLEKFYNKINTSNYSFYTRNNLIKWFTHDDYQYNYLFVLISYKLDVTHLVDNALI